MRMKIFAVISMVFLVFGCGDDEDSQISAPTSLQANATDQGAVDLNWEDRSDNETGFEIERAVEGENFEILHTTGADVESYRDEDVDQGLVYNYRVRAVNADQMSAYSNIASTSPEFLAAPENLQSNNESSTTVTLTWSDRSVNETGFEIERSLLEDFPDAETFDVAANETTFEDSGLTPETQYYYRVRAVNENITSDYCTPLAVQTAAVPVSAPAAPSELVAEAISSSQIRLTWVDNSEDEDGFTLMWSTDGEVFEELPEIEANSRTIVHEELASQQTYFYQILAFNSAGPSETTAVAEAQTLEEPTMAPAAPSELEAEAITSSRIRLTWADNSDDEDGFILMWSTDGETFEELPEIGANSRTHTHEELTAQTTYFYKIVAFNSAGSSETSAVSEAQTPEESTTPPDAPQGFDYSDLTSDSVRLSWTDSSDNEAGFRLQRADNAGFEGADVIEIDVNETSYSDTGLSSDTTYYYRIQAFNEAGNSSYAGPISITTQTDNHIPVSSILTPFDANMNDLLGPAHWYAQYGKTPEIVVSSNGVELEVLAQDYDAGTAWNAVLLHIEPGSNGEYKITQALTDIPMLDRVMGLATDSSGNRYYATGVDEDDEVTLAYPPNDTYRNDIVRVIKLNPDGEVLFNIDLDTARYAYNNEAKMLINPMVAATSRLVVGGNEIALVHGVNTDIGDDNIRHQMSLSTRLDATSGAITRTSSIWVSHSFDQRLLYDGQGIIEYHLGDAFPRQIVISRNHAPFPLFYIKGALGANNTYTRLGDMALIEDDPTYRYMALFVTEYSAGTGTEGRIYGPRNLAIVRVNGSDNSIDPNLPDTLTVHSVDANYTNRLRWLTDYSNSSNLHAERPKLIGIGGGQYVVLWEQWQNINSYTDTFNGVYGMVVGDEGNIVQEAMLITDMHHLHRGDDAFLLDGRAAWITGDAAEQQLNIHFVDASLNYEMVTLD